MKKGLHLKSALYFSVLLFFLLAPRLAVGQTTGISAAGAVPPNPAAGLDVNFADRGLLAPRVALTGTASFAPLAAHVAGMIVYNTATTGDVSPGFYYNNGTRWIQGLPKAGTTGDMQYWDGTAWQVIPAGQPGQSLQLNALGIPAWAGAGFANLTTAAVTGISATGATTGGNIANDGGFAVTAYGVCWSTSPNPTIALPTKTTDGSGTGAFVSTISGLTTGTVYYVRAYATNSTGTSYGNPIIFTTL